MAERCLVCDVPVESDRSVVREKGMEGLFKASIARKDGKSSVFENKTCGIVHNSCRKRYTRPQSVASDLKNAEVESHSSAGSCRRSKVPTFDFKTKCLFCCGAINDEFYRKQKKNHWKSGRQYFKCAVWR